MTKNAFNDDEDCRQHFEDDDDLSINNIEPLTAAQQTEMFISGFMPKHTPKDIISLISTEWLDPSFRWSLGLLEWRPYTYLTNKIVSDTYGLNNNILQSIYYAISQCITHKQLDITALIEDIMNTSVNKSCLVLFVTKAISPNTNKGLQLFREKLKVHTMLYDIVSYPNTHQYTTKSDAIHSQPRDIRLLALECIPSPSMGVAFQSSLSNMSPLSISLDLCNPFPGDIDSFDGDASFIFDTMRHEYPEKGENDIRRLYNLINTQYINICDVEYINMDIDEILTLRLSILHLLEKECPSFVANNNRIMVVSKGIDLINRKAVIMNIVNLFTEMRMASHYIEMLKRKHPSFIDLNEEQLSIEPFRNYDNILSINSFLVNYPLFESLRSRLKYSYAIHCISSTVTHIVNKILRPLPFEPTHIIHDSYSDFVMYLTQISRFIHNKVMNRDRSYHFDHIMLNSLHFPIQIDFMIIPQCVSECKIEALMQRDILMDYDSQCSRLRFGIGDECIDNIGDKLHEFGIECKEIEIDREPAHFYKTLSREFESVQNTKRHRRYIVIIDRRNPRFDAKYTLNNHNKDWKDRLYIFCPPNYNSISPRCDVLPEGFIHRTLQYLLPLKEDVVIGGNCVANGYIFCLSYHLFQEDEIKTYFHWNGYGQRFTRDELKYYIPRLFMKIDDKFQDEMNISTNKATLDMFKDIKDEQHTIFHQQTMK